LNKPDKRELELVSNDGRCFADLSQRLGEGASEESSFCFLSIEDIAEETSW
jgi:hypothetical protein